MMNMPKAISTWAMVLFFLFEGLSLVGVGVIPPIITGLCALVAAVFLFLGR